MQNPYARLASLRAEMYAARLALANCEAHEIIELSARYEDLVARVDFWAEKIADWSSDHA